MTNFASLGTRNLETLTRVPHETNQKTKELQQQTRGPRYRPLCYGCTLRSLLFERHGILPKVCSCNCLDNQTNAFKCVYES